MKINKLLESKKIKEEISSNEPAFKFQGKSSHTFTKDKKWEVDFDEKGNIVARTRHGKPSYFKGHINDKVNDFPSTDEDNIILAAREQHGLKFGNKEVKEDVSYEWKPNTSFKHIKDIYNKVKANDYKYVNNEREEFMAAVKKADNKGYKPEECRQIKDWHRDIWSHNRKTEAYAHFEFTSGSNPYIAKTKDEVERIKRSHRDSVRYVGNINGIDYYKVDDSEKDLFRVEEGWYEGHLDTMQRKTSGYDKCYKIVKKARTSNPIDTNALNDARDHFGYDLYKMCLDDVLKEMDNLNESFKPSDSGIQSVKCYNRYNYTIQELRVDNDNKTFERGQFTVGKPDKKTKNRQEFEDIVDSLKELGYTEIESEYKSMRNKSRKGNLTNVEEGYELNPDIDIAWRPYDNEKGQVMADKWYASKWPDDEVGIEQLTGITLDDALKDRSILGHCDTQVKERVYAQLDKYIPLSFDSPMYKEKNESKSTNVDGCWAIFAKDNTGGIEYCGGVYNSEDSAHYWASMDRLADSEYGYGNFTYRVEQVPEYSRELYNSYVALQNLKLDNSNKNQELSEASYGGAFDIADDQYFTKDDLMSFADEVLGHISETFNGVYDIGGVWFEDGNVITQIVNDSGDEFEDTTRVDMRRIREPWHLKRAYASQVASNIIQQIKDLDADVVVESKELNETNYGKDELWSQLNNNEYAYNKLANTVKWGIEKSLSKDRIVTAVAKAIFSMKDDFGRLPTTREERLELARDFVEDEVQGFSYEENENEPSYRRTGSWNKLGEAVTSSSIEFDDDVDDLTYYYDDDIWEEPGVDPRKDFIEEGKEFTWVKRCSDTEHLDFDNWAVWEAYCHDDAETYYFVVEEDTEFIDWGPCDTLDEAREFLQSKVDDYNAPDEDDMWGADDFDSIEEDVEESPIVHKKSDGSYLVAAESGDGYTAYNKSDVCVGHISANNENEAKSKFNSNKFDESLEDAKMELDNYKVTYYLPYYDDGFGDDMMNNVMTIEAPNQAVANEIAIRHKNRMKKSANGSAWQTAEIVSVEKC